MINSLKRLNEALPGLLLGILIYGGLLELIGVWFVSNKSTYTVGVLVGIVCAIGCAIHLAMVIEESVRIGEGHNKLLAVKSVGRYIVVCLIFAVMTWLKVGDILSAALGFLGLKVSAYAQPFLYKTLLKRTQGGNVSQENE